jgi:lactate dehydrogenase-like 2-hydroxyacid dehydrogenase
VEDLRRYPQSRHQRHRAAGRHARHGTRSKPAPAFVRFIDILRGTPDLKWLHTYTAGADHRFYVELMAQGLTVATSAGANSDVVAHSALSGLLALARRLPASMDAQRRHAWEPLYSNEPRDLLGQRAVIVGLGPIGQEIGRLRAAFGLKVTGVRHTGGLPPPAGFERCVTYSELGSVLPDADWLILSCPLSDSTRKIINADRLARLPAHAQIINVAARWSNNRICWRHFKPEKSPAPISTCSRSSRCRPTQDFGICPTCW